MDSEGPDQPVHRLIWAFTVHKHPESIFLLVAAQVSTISYASTTQTCLAALYWYFEYFKSPPWKHQHVKVSQH